MRFAVVLVATIVAVAVIAVALAIVALVSLPDAGNGCRRRDAAEGVELALGPFAELFVVVVAVVAAAVVRFRSVFGRV